MEPIGDTTSDGTSPVRSDHSNGASRGASLGGLSGSEEGVHPMAADLAGTSHGKARASLGGLPGSGEHPLADDVWRASHGMARAFAVVQIDPAIGGFMLPYQASLF